VAAVFAALLGGATLLGIGCVQILSVDDLRVTASGSDGGAETSGVMGTSMDASHADARGADAAESDGCMPGTNRGTLENACTNAMCVPFDNTRVVRCTDDAGLLTCPPIPPSDAGIPAPQPLDAAVTQGDAGPLPPCSSLPTLNGFTFPKPYVFGSGSSALSLYVGKLAQAFANQGEGTIIYQIAGSCYGSYTTVLADQYPLAAVPATTGNATATYFDPVQSDENGVPLQYTCAIDEPTRTADFGVSDVFPATCLPQLNQTGGLPNNLHDFYGPIQTMVLAVPAGSTETSISADAAYMVWGFGSASGVAPWTDVAYLLQRSGSSGTQSMMAATISVNAFSWQGVMHSSNQAVLSAMLQAAANPDTSAQQSTMGILGADFVEDNRAQINVLAFQDRGQTCGYYPDSTPTAHDKQNVRDGHYPVWGPSHFIAPVDTNGQPINGTVSEFVDALAGTVTVNGLNLLQTYQQRHLVPVCAMHVTRSSDGQDYQPYTPETSCSCYYDYLTTGQTSCVTCQNAGDCAHAPNGATSCNMFGAPALGYCEPPGTGQ
jgi:hypothetical protein